MSKAIDRNLIIPDIHAPYHHRASWRCVLQVIENWQPHGITFLGDAIDSYSISNHLRDPGRRILYQEEVDGTNEVLDEVDYFRPSGTRVVFCEGNHETRLARYVALHAPELHGAIPTIKEKLKIAERGWTWVPYGHLHAIAGSKLNAVHDLGYSGITAPRQSRQAAGANVVFGHTHRAGSDYASTVTGERHCGFAMGWLGDPEWIDYAHRARVLADAQHGFGIAHVEVATGLGWVHFVPIIGGRACVDGRMYG